MFSYLWIYCLPLVRVYCIPSFGFHYLPLSGSCLSIVRVFIALSISSKYLRQVGYQRWSLLLELNVTTLILKWVSDILDHQISYTSLRFQLYTTSPEQRKVSDILDFSNGFQLLTVFIYFSQIPIILPPVQRKGRESFRSFRRLLYNQIFMQPSNTRCDRWALGAIICNSKSYDIAALLEM